MSETRTGSPGWTTDGRRGTAEPAERRAWHTRSVDEVVQAQGVDLSRGLGAAEAEQRRSRFGDNVLDEAERVPAWKRLKRHLTDEMTIVLVIAAIVSAAVAREWETPIVILLVVTFNTVLNYVQESKAESSLEALRNMSVATSRVRRDGRETQVERNEIVPGDVVLLEAGDTVPADGRVVGASRLQVAEAALTGESEPVDKGTQTLENPEAALGDRTDMVFMNTEVTRGRATVVVTGTGMDTQMGEIAGLLGGAGEAKTPLQRRIDKLARMLTIIALVVVVIVFALGLLRGQSWSELLLTAVSLAVATIPEGLTAVVAFTLAMGASRLADQGAIIKQLSAVETLGSTTQIATDKTGTLTLNEMTVRRMVTSDQRFKVSGEGYDTNGRVLTSDGNPPAQQLGDAFLSMALANDGIVDHGDLVGDPTDGALVVLAEKGGVDVEGARKALPRVGEVPFDSDYKFQATFHERDGGIFLAAKGAPRAILDRSTSVLTATGTRPMTRRDREVLDGHVSALAEEGLRTLLIAARRLDSLPGDGDDSSALFDSVDELTTLALVGIVDPPRTEAADAIREARQAGIAVHMITGDHLVTASAIASQLGIPGEAVSGSDLDNMNDNELQERAEGIGVLARVAPEHKIRTVKAMQERGNVVAMTGDGVNDAPALKQADIGVAMGITGTDVSKGAARMILTDDNFATIVQAIRMGRGIYDNILKFVRFQLTTSWGFIVIFMVSSLFAIAGGAPFTALQILWVNIIMDGPPALALGVEPTDADVMHRPPRPVNEPILTPNRIGLVLTGALIMGGITLGVLVRGADIFPGITQTQLTTLAFTTFVFFQVFNLFAVRSERSVFSTRTFTNAAIWVAVALVILLQVLVVETDFLQGIFGTEALTSSQWTFAVALASVILWVEEIRKLIVNRGAKQRPTGGARAGETAGLTRA